jgi:uncharacterized membrane protein
MGWSAIIQAIEKIVTGIVGGVNHANTEYSNRMNRYHTTSNNSVLMSLIPIVIIVIVIFAALAFENKSK